MFSDPVSFNGGTRVEVIAVLANCGRDTDRARRALVTWIRHKQDKGRSTEHILAKLRDIESKARPKLSPGLRVRLTPSKFIKDTSLHSAFRDARAETFLPRAPDLPLPYSIRRKSEPGPPESLVSLKASISHNTKPNLTSSSSIELPTDSKRLISPPSSPLRLSQNSSQISEALPGKSTTRRSLPDGVPHVPPYRSPRIQIPCDRTLQPGPSSPVTSSPEESGLHLRYRYNSHPVAPSYQSYGLMTPSSTSPPGGSRSSRGQGPDPGSRLSYGSVSSIPRSQSRRSIPISPPTSSSDESELRYRPISQPMGSMSPGLRRITPPKTSPPKLPLPPIPSDDQGVDSDSDVLSENLRVEQPPTPMRSTILHSSAVVRPLPIQPIPSPIPDSDESENVDMITENLSRQHGQESNGELSSPNDVTREDSPLYVFHDDHASSTGIGPPPPYVGQLDTYFPPDMPTIGDTLDRAVKVSGDSPEVRRVVSKCIGFHRGYEPPYWQTRLQTCGLNAEAAKYLVDEMCREVDWTASSGRTTR